MDTDDLEPRKAKAKPKDLDEMSVEAIGDYIDELKAEIEPAEAAIKAKHTARSGADAFFTI